MRKGGGVYGYTLHLAVCTRTGLPLAWRVETARRNESLYVAPSARHTPRSRIPPKTCAMDKGCTTTPGDGRDARARLRPHRLPAQGTLDPTNAIPDGTDEWKRLYRGGAAVEREFGLLKNEYALTPLRTRGLPASGNAPTL